MYERIQLLVNFSGSTSYVVVYRKYRNIEITLRALRKL